MKRFLITKVAALATVISSLLLFIPIASAGAYPTKPVKVIVPWAHGGGTDITMRSLLTVMDKYFPQRMVVVNRPGGAGTVGTTEALRAKPDGYTVLFTAWGPLVTQPSLKTLQYTENDYITVLQTNVIPRILSAYPPMPYNDIKEMMEYAKRNPEKIKVGVAGVGTTGHLAMVQLEQGFGVKFTLVPMGGGGPQKTALLGGHVDVAPLNAVEAGPLVVAKQIKPLGVMDSKRFADIPEIPTTGELGFAVESGVAWVLVVPKGTPPDRIKVLHDAFKSCLEDKTFQKIAKRLNLGLEYLDGEAARTKLEKFRKLYADIAARLGLKKK